MAIRIVLFLPVCLVVLLACCCCLICELRRARLCQTRVELVSKGRTLRGESIRVEQEYQVAQPAESENNKS